MHVDADTDVSGVGGVQTFSVCVRACYNLAGMAAPLYFQDGSSERTHYMLRDALALHYSIARPAV